MNEKIVSSYIPDDYSPEETKTERFIGNLIALIVLCLITFIAAFASLKILEAIGALKTGILQFEHLLSPSKCLEDFYSLGNFAELFPSITSMPFFIQRAFAFFYVYVVTIGSPVVLALIILIGVPAILKSWSCWRVEYVHRS